MTISNVELEELCGKKGITLDGIVMSNELINVKKKKRLNIIINLDDRGNGGTHWVCLCIRDGKEAFYFDSFGAMCDKYVIDYCKKIRVSLSINVYIIQHLESTECGLFCVGLMKFLKKEKILAGVTREYPKSRLYELSNEYINIFEPNTELNDNIIFKYLR